ncbi:Uncharacterized alpha/beta hydrolase domain [Mesonia phycicola]|uniref:Uncharacterized alpha/beta hydrolase domain n=1 Tax=Mesonia phycicola TaxID=579105 RepID=A0A1M6FYY4_9FLAO|nr:DUF2235 domain-containing protein [Mesonia phycicola]SHJ02837.1 Uncharacterized alpha/beta hydrolase domain [Mesonia phycicola]
MPIDLTSSPTGAENTKSFLDEIDVQTAPTFVEESSHEDFEESESKNVMVGVFIDGTWNNRNNTDARLEYEKADDDPSKNFELAARYINDDVASFENYYSNIARMEPYYENLNTEKLITFKLYIEGIGTENFEDDSTIGGGFGTGSTGILAKVEKACEQIVNLTKKKEVENINTLTIDVFGFSRGAAAARNLVHEVSKPFQAEKVVYNYNRSGSARKTIIPEKPRHGHLGSELKKNGIPLRMLIIRFVGIYDTVSSHGAGVVFSYDNDTEALGLDAIRKAQFTLHLTAADEHRKNFSLTNIQSALQSGRGKEFSLPGVHGDLGGSYNDKEEEKRRFSYNDRDFVINQGWYSPEQLEVVQWDQDGMGASVIEGTRTLSNTYTHIPLSIMASFTTQKNLPLKAEQLKSAYAIPSALTAIKNRIDEYVFNNGNPLDFENEEDKLLLIPVRRDYLHFSAQFASLTMGPRRKFWSRERYRKIITG